MDSGGGSFRALIARLKSAPPWVWISIILAAGVLVVSWLIYRNQQNNANVSASGLTVGSVPANGQGQPLWPTDTSGFNSSNFADMLALLQYIQSTQTPNPSPTAAPGPTKATTITLSKPESLNQIAAENGLNPSQVSWLQKWNQQLSRQPGFNKPWWTLPAGTKVNIPKAS